MKLIMTSESVTINPANKGSVEVTLDGVWLQGLIDKLPEYIDVSDIVQAYGSNNVLDVIDRKFVANHLGIVLEDE